MWQKRFMFRTLAFKNGLISNFKGLVTVTLDQVILHCGASLIDLYLHAKFHGNQRTFLWTDRCTDGHFRQALLGRLCRRVVLKMRGRMPTTLLNSRVIGLTFTKFRHCS